MARKKIKEVEATAKTSQIIEIKENFAYRFGYEMQKESLKAFKNRTLSAIVSVIGNDRYDINYYSREIFDLVAYPFVDKINLSFVNSDLNAVLKAIDIEENKSNLYIWLQILELIANSCYSSDDNSKQIWFVRDIATALKLSGVNAVICSTSSGYKFYPASERFLDEKLVIDILNWLSKYDKAKEQFEKALQLTLKGQNSRQVVDCLRLSLELFLKQYLNNSKSLENQHDILGKKLSEKNISVEVRNMFIKLLDYYEKYNNEHAKHDDSTNEEELDFLIYLTGNFLRLLIKIK